MTQCAECYILYKHATVHLVGSAENYVICSAPLYIKPTCMYLSGFGRETLLYRTSVFPLIVTVFGTVIFRYPFVSPSSNTSVRHVC
jgi:hypothetical protein